MRCIGRKYRIKTGRPGGGSNIQRQRSANVVETTVIDPAIDSGMIFGKVTGLPENIRQLLGKKYRMLGSAAAYFQYPVRRLQIALNNRQNWPFVIFAGLAEWFVQLLFPATGSGVIPRKNQFPVIRQGGIERIALRVEMPEVFNFLYAIVDDIARHHAASFFGIETDNFVLASF